MGRRFTAGALAGLTTVLVTLAGVTGCANHSTPTDPTTSADPPSTTATTPSTSTPPPAAPTLPADVPTTGPNLLHPGEKPPLEPAAALAHTPAGAQAFARFFIQTIDWGYATTNPNYMKHYFTDSCIQCKNGVTLLKTAADRGYHYVGGRITIGTPSQATPSGSIPAAISVDVPVDLASIEWVDGKNTFVGADIAHRGGNEAVTVAWQTDRWMVVSLKASGR